MKDIYTIAKDSLGKHITLNEAVPTSVGCAEAISYVLKEAGYDIPETGIQGTIALKEWLGNNFDIVYDVIEKGCIIISPTVGSQHGHVGIVGEFNLEYPNDYGILSNKSATGLFSEHWNLTSWVTYYKHELGLDVLFYKPKEIIMQIETPVVAVPTQPVVIPTWAQSSIDPTQVALSIKSAGKVLAGIIVLLSSVLGFNAVGATQALSGGIDALVIAVPAVFTIYHTIQLVSGILRKAFVKFTNR